MAELDLELWGNFLPQETTIDIMNIAINDLNVPPSYPITLKHYEALWGDSEVAQLNNNWGGVTWNPNWSDPHVRESGVTVTRGTSRPAIEGGHYVKFQSVEDYFIDWAWLMSADGAGIYNVQDSETFDECVHGMFRVGGATYDYATMNVEGSQQRYELYLAQMQARRNAINQANNNLLDRLDNGEFDHLVNGNGNGGGGNGQLINQIIQIINNGRDDIESEINMDDLKDIFNPPLFKVSEQFFRNHYFKATKTYDNLLKINPNQEFDHIEFSLNIDEVFDSIIQQIRNLDDGNGNGGTPSSDPVFPVDFTREGINFWKKSNYSLGQLQYQMCYGWTREGGNRFHAGYDIGGGGRTHPIYAVEDGTVVDARYQDLSGYLIIIEHDNDEYYSLYQHLQENSTLVSIGETVSKGQEIASMGGSGGNYDIHLHFELSPTGEFWTEQGTVDPESYLGVVADNTTELQNPV